MSKISNEEMIKAIDNDEYQKIMSKASQKFAKILNRDELESCKMTALWKALENYDGSRTNSKNKKSKFTSYLYRGVELECKTAVKFVLAGRRNESILHDNIGVESNSIEAFELKDEISKTEYGEILEDVYYNGLNTKELSKKFGVSKQIIAIRKKRALNFLKARIG